MSIQKQDVSDVIAPVTLGKRAEIKAMINITPDRSAQSAFTQRNSGKQIIRGCCYSF